MYQVHFLGYFRIPCYLLLLCRNEGPNSRFPQSFLLQDDVTNAEKLEELTEVFKAKNPVKYSLRKKEVVIHGDAGVTEVLEEKRDIELIS